MTVTDTTQEFVGVRNRHDGPGPLDARLVLARRLVELRQRRGFTIAVLARRARLAPATVYRLEAADGLPTTLTVEKLARALEVSPGTLFRLDGRRKDQRVLLEQAVAE